MKVRIGREELMTGLQRVQGVVEKRNTMPILSNILLEAKHDGLKSSRRISKSGCAGLYKATVLEAGRRHHFGAQAVRDHQGTAERRDRAHLGREQLDDHPSGKSQFKVVGLLSSDYPALPSIEREGLTPLAGAGLLELIRKTLFAAGDDRCPLHPSTACSSV